MQKYHSFIFSLIVAIYAHLTFAIPTQVPNQEIHDAQDKKYTLCSTQDCLNVASTILDNIDRTVKPCDNFYQFACGGWVKKHPVNDSIPTITAMNYMDKYTNEQINEILKDVPQSDDTLSLKKAKKMYAMCMDENERERIGSSTLRELVRENGGWPICMPFMSWDNSTWQQIGDLMLDTILSNNLYNIQVMVDDKKSDSHIINIIGPEFFLSQANMLKIGQDLDKKETYKSFIEDVARVFMKESHVSIQDETLSKDALDIVEFEVALAKIAMSCEDRRNVDKAYNEFTIENFQKEYDAQHPTSKSKIDWFTVLRRLFTPLGIRLEPSEKIVVQAHEFLIRLVPLLERTSDRVIVNYMQWVTIRNMLKFSSPSLQEMHFKIQKQFMGHTPNSSMWKICIRNPNLDMAISYEYSKKYVEYENVEDVNVIITDIKNAVHEQISKSSWMDETTKNASLDKLAHMRKQINAPEWFTDEAIDKYYDGLSIASEYLESVVNLNKFKDIKLFRKLREPVDKKEWRVKPTVVQGFNDPAGNVIIITAGFLKDPVYVGKRPLFMNYGALGFVIGHEVNHGFDESGRKFDKNGNSVQWWPQETIDIYENLTQCFVEQYNNYPVSGLNNVYEDGELTLEENIADSAAATASYKAYKNRKTKLNLPDVRLPGLEEYSDEQLLFMSTAHMFCENATPKLLKILHQFEYPRAESRIRGSFSNSYEFSTVYGCSVGKAMNPEKKCILWQ